MTLIAHRRGYVGRVERTEHACRTCRGAGVVHHATEDGHRRGRCPACGGEGTIARLRAVPDDEEVPN